MNGSYFNNTFMGENSLSNDKIYQNNLYDVDYTENILKLNVGKKVRLYASFPGSSEWQDKIFEGIIENTGKDYIIISDPKNGEWNLILFIYINFISFEEIVNYRTT